MRSYEAALLDIDGTLIESNEQQAYAWCEALQNLGYAVGYAAVAPLIGMGGESLVPLVTGLPSSALAVREIVQEQSRIFHTRYLHTLRPTPGARALLECLRGLGLVIVAISASSASYASSTLERVGLSPFVDVVAAADEVGNARSASACIVSALRKAHTSSSRCVLIGDSPYDVDAGLRAEVDVIAVRCGGYSDAVLEGASILFDHPRALVHALTYTTLDRLVSSPFHPGYTQPNAPLERHLQS